MAVTFLVLDSVTVRVGLVSGMGLDLCRVRDSRGRVVTALLARAPATVRAAAARRSTSQLVLRVTVRTG